MTTDNTTPPHVTAADSADTELVTTLANPSGEADQSSNRRHFLRTGVVAAGTGLLATALVRQNVKAASPPPDNNALFSPPTTPFVVPLPVYGAKSASSTLSPSPTKAAQTNEAGRLPHQRWEQFPTKKLIEIHIKQGLHSFHPQYPTQTIWGFDGICPGPTLVGRYGQPLLVRFYNDLPANLTGFGSPEISTHAHNLHDGSESDGFAGDYFSATKFGPTLTRPGMFKDHLYPMIYAGYDKYPATNGDPREALGSCWYHDHRMDFTSGNVSRGMAGSFLVFDEIDSGNEKDSNSKALRLPSGIGIYDIPLIVQDKRFDANGMAVFDQFNTDGYIGDKFCVNGKIQPYFKVQRRKYRFRLLNASTSRFYQFYLVLQNVDQTFTYISNDGNLLPAPLQMSQVRLGPAERGDIVIDFSKYPLSSRLFLVDRIEQLDGRGPQNNLVFPGTQILRFDVDADPSTADTSQVPATLRALPPITMSEVVQSRIWKFDRTASGWSINGQLWDVDKPGAIIKKGTAEVWTLQVNGNWWHPIHIHLEEFQILSRNGVAPPPHERGRKDVVSIGPGEEVKIFIRFRDYTGKYMMHCHNSIHEDHAMMVRFDVVP